MRLQTKISLDSPHQWSTISGGDREELKQTVTTGQYKYYSLWTTTTSIALSLQLVSELSDEVKNCDPHQPSASALFS